MEDQAIIFLKIARMVLERILGFGDREPSSPTFGCYDRYYWHYKLHDLPNARLQEAILYLSRIRPFVLEVARSSISKWIRGGIEFWSRQRHSDGSVDEIYPWERSFCATAMSCQAVTAAWLNLDIRPEVDFTHTGHWLTVNSNADVTNQMAAACLALYRIFQITGERRFEQAAYNKFLAIARRQMSNGCYREYDGADIGYATITLSLLGQYAQMSELQEVWDSMRRCEFFLRSVVDMDGRYRYEDTSRQTQFLYPSGLARLNSPIVERIIDGLRNNRIINPLWLDDRYCIPLATDYLDAYLALTKSEKS